jgi:hypothetical protein
METEEKVETPKEADYNQLVDYWNLP